MNKKLIVSAICLTMIVATATSAYAMNTNDKLYKTHTDSSSGKKIITVESNIKDLGDLAKHKDNQDKKIKVLKFNNISKEEKDLINNSTVTITFKEAISLDKFNDILKNNKVKLVDFEGKFLNDKNDWITGNFKEADKNKIDRAIESSISKGREKQLEFKGITSARVIIDLESKTFEGLSSNSDIYLVDITDTLVRLENKDYAKQLKIRVPDLAWEIDKIK